MAWGRRGGQPGPLGPYQVGSGGHALGALLGGIARAGAEVGAGHATPVEGAEDADGGPARADDEELLPVAGVDSVVPQHLAQVPCKRRAQAVLARGDTGTMAATVHGILTAGCSEDILGWGVYGANGTRVGLRQRRRACSKSYIQHCSWEVGKQHGIAELVSKGKQKLGAGPQARKNTYGRIPGRVVKRLEKIRLVMETWGEESKDEPEMFTQR